ncbi:MAG: ABC transporter substrate-binding protein [Hyphomicrobiales bacterium]|nr:ABC transporter substrate-binding protein [Hyphomicrobiales bacterium]
MKRMVSRACVVMLAAATLLAPTALRAQPPNLPVIGILNSAAPGLRAEQMAAFRLGLKKHGFVEKQNVLIEYRGADNRYDRLPGLAAELVKHPVAVIVAAGGPISAIHARKVTTTVPIVFTTIADPVRYGLVASLNRPGGNVTGNAGLTSELDPKRLELLHKLKPGSGPIAVLINPNRPDVDNQMRAVHAGAEAIRRGLLVLRTASDEAVEQAFATFAEKRVEALLVTADPFFANRRTMLIGLAERYKLPAIYQWREFPAAGGLMSYGPNIADAYVQTGVFVGRILKGERPADLPVMVPDRFEFVINLKTAKALGITAPRALLSLANEMIE